MFGFAVPIWVKPVAILLAAGACFSGGWTANDWRRDSKALEQKQADDKEAFRRSEREGEKGRAFEQDKSQIVKQLRPIIREVERVVEKPVYRNLCLDDDGMRLLRSAIAGPEVPASEPLRTLPRSGGTGER